MNAKPQLRRSSDLPIEAERLLDALPTLPKVALEVIRLVDSPFASAADLRRAVGEDAILTARILQAVNASTHGLSRRIADIERAILILGLNTVRNLAIITSAERFFQPRREAGRFRSLANELWRHATTTASAAKLLAMELPEPHPYLTSEEFYVIGLIHDVGIMAELYSDRDRLIEALERVQPLDDIARSEGSAPRKDLRALELEVFGFDHAALGRRLCDRWQFPTFLLDGVGFHHSPMDAAEDARPAAMLVSIADRVAASVPGGFADDLPSLEVDDEELELIGLDEEALDRVRYQLQADLAPAPRR
jgi:HD-like signal output (HDOD) protein